MTDKSLLAFRGTAGLYFILGLAFMFVDKTAAAAVFFMLGICLMVRTHDSGGLPGAKPTHIGVGSVYCCPVGVP